MTHVVVVNLSAIAEGRSAFFEYQKYLSCGSASRSFEKGRFRATGPEMIVGAIYACIERGISSRDEIIAAAAKATRCRWWTVDQVLDELTGEGQNGYPFSFDGEVYRVNGIPRC